MNKLIRKAQKRFPKNSRFYQFCKKIYMLPKILFSKQGYINQYLFFPISSFMRRHHAKPFYSKKYKELERIKNKHQNKRCFIIATGPSLTIKDVEKLKGEITIGVNSLFRIFDKTSFRPMYYAALDPVLQNVVENNIDKYDVFCKDTIFFNSLYKKSRHKVSYIPLCYQNHWFNIDNPRFNYLKNLKYSTDLVSGLFDKYTITNIAIEIAIYMGCSEIYLLGVDCNYTGPQIHFDKSDNTDNINLDSGYFLQKAMMSGYKFMEKETKTRGIRVYNATRGGMLEEFERVDFDSLF